jgi:hypothetical protein
MKFWNRIVVILMLTAGMLGCAKTVTAPVPGQLNTFDAYAFRTLADAQAAINAFKADVVSGKVTETPTLKTVLNQTITDYNDAETVYQVWRAAGGTGSVTPVSSAISKVQTDITSIATTAGGK